MLTCVVASLFGLDVFCKPCLVHNWCRGREKRDSHQFLDSFPVFQRHPVSATSIMPNIVFGRDPRVPLNRGDGLPRRPLSLRATPPRPTDSRPPPLPRHQLHAPSAARCCSCPWITSATTSLRTKPSRTSGGRQIETTTFSVMATPSSSRPQARRALQLSLQTHPDTTPGSYGPPCV